MTMTMADLPTADDVGVAARADRPKRRRFTQEYKARILAEYDAAGHGQRGAILRREGLYTSHLVEWRRSLSAAGGQGGASGGRRGGKDPRDAQIEALTARAARAEAELARTRAALDLVGKAHALLETLSESADTPPRSTR